MYKEKIEEERFFWKPKTELGREVSEGRISSIDDIFKTSRRIMEPEIVDRLLPDLHNETIFIGGSPGKGGGSRPTPTKRTARMHRSGRRYNMLALVVVGNMDGYLGIGKGEALEHRTAIEKALENAKLNIIPVKRGCGSWECACKEKHSIPISVKGKSGSVTVELKPAPKGIGLCVNDEAKKIMKMAGIRDIWSKTFGDPRTRINYIYAIFSAFKEMNRMKIPEKEQEEKPVVEEKPELEAVSALGEMEIEEAKTKKEENEKKEEKKETKKVRREKKVAKKTEKSKKKPSKAKGEKKKEKKEEEKGDSVLVKEE